MVSVIVGGLEGAALTGGLGAVGAAFYSIGIPKDSIIKYEKDLKADKFLLIAHGGKDDVERAADILRTRQDAEVMLHADA